MTKMFHSRSRDTQPTASPTPPPNGNGRRGAAGMFSVLGADVTVTGNVAASADLHIDGRVDGDVACGSLIQGTESAIHGGVTAETARIAGAIDGSVRVRQLVVERTARIAGDIEYETITIESGGQIDGALRRVTTLNITPVPATATTLLPHATQGEEQVQLIG
jgi:cytoskeletal protein CcmA (bactofilin family)